MFNNTLKGLVTLLIILLFYFYEYDIFSLSWTTKHG